MESEWRDRGGEGNKRRWVEGEGGEETSEEGREEKGR